MGSPTLILPTIELQDEFAQFAAEYRAAGEDRYDLIEKQFGGNFAAYVQSLHDFSNGIGLAPELVPQTTYWLAQDGRILGASRLRHGLSPLLIDWGGHIGYDIRPSERRKGYGTLLLRLMLGKARERGLDRVMLTCDATNIGSIGVICNNGGALDQEYHLERVGVRVRRYWIAVAPA